MCSCCQPGAAVNVTARLPSGSVLAQLAVDHRTPVSQLKVQLQDLVQLPPGCVVGGLVLDAEKLADHETFKAEEVELLVVLHDALVGEFEDFKPGCPTCASGSNMQSLRFFPDGTVLIQTNSESKDLKFHCRLGAVSGEWRDFDLLDDRGELQYWGLLQVSASNPIQRRVIIEELGIDLEDVRYLKQQNKTALEQKLAILWRDEAVAFRPHDYWGDAWKRWADTSNPSAITSYEEEVWESFWQDYWQRAAAAWTELEVRREEEVLSLAEMYDETLSAKHTRMRKIAGKKRKSAYWASGALAVH